MPEARSKDFGIIATEHGWNLYVCGNGGFRPRHADLLVSDVDTETLVKIIDRFLMFYIRTPTGCSAPPGDCRPWRAGWSTCAP